MRKIYLIILALGVSAASFAQKKWTLQDCIQYAIENNLDIQKMQIQKESSEITLNTSKMSRLPDLNAGLGQSFSFGRS